MVANRSALRRSITMLVLGSSGTSLFLLPFLHEIYYEALRNALGHSNVQLGSLSAAYGLASLLGYLPGGLLADRVPPRILLPIGLIGTGTGGLLFASFPPYPIALLLYVLWGAMTVICWGAMIRATREWAPPDRQGHAFGIFEGVRGTTEAAIGAAGVMLFAWAGSSNGALGNVILNFSALNMALGVIAFLALERTAMVRVDTAADADGSWRDLPLNPDVWLISFIVLASYSAYTALYYFTPYSSNILQLSVALAGAIAVAKIWLKPIAALSAGIVADRWGVSRTLVVGFAIVTGNLMVFALIPGSTSNAPLMVANLACASLAVFAIRGVYFALLEQCQIPETQTGSVTGLASLVGFTPDIFIPPLAGILLDSFAGQSGYRLFFGLIGTICAMGLLASVQIGRRIRAR